MDRSHTMKLLIVAGGGGHFAPVVPFIESLPKHVEILVVGRKYGLEGDTAISFEYETALAKQIPFVALRTGRLQRKWTRYTLSSLVRFPYGIVQAVRIVSQFKPDVVLSFGGYVSVPVAIAAFLLRIPIVIHEQTLEAGLSNKIASFFAKKICISWNSSRQFFPKEKTILTGNPIKKLKNHNGNRDITALNKNIPTIYITGGSLGSHAINVAIEGCIEKLLEHCIVFHQTGDAKKYNDFDRLQKKRETLPDRLKNRYHVMKFVHFDQVPLFYQKADLVVARAGINTISELLSSQTPSLLIPLPFAQNNEQEKNANFLKSFGFAEIIRQDDLSSEKLLSLVISMLKHKEQYREASERTKHIFPHNASLQLFNVIQEVVRK